MTLPPLHSHFRHPLARNLRSQRRNLHTSKGCWSVASLPSTLWATLSNFPTQRHALMHTQQLRGYAKHRLPAPSPHLPLVLNFHLLLAESRPQELIDDRALIRWEDRAGSRHRCACVMIITGSAPTCCRLLTHRVMIERHLPPCNKRLVYI